MEPLMKCSEVAELFGVDHQTVSRWALQGKIRSIQTPGGHYRFDRDYVVGLIESQRRTLDEPR